MQASGKSHITPEHGFKLNTLNQTSTRIENDPYRKKIRRNTPLILRKSYFYQKSVKASASQLKFLDTPSKKTNYIMKMIDTLRDVEEDETNAPLTFAFIKDVFNTYHIIFDINPTHSELDIKTIILKVLRTNAKAFFDKQFNIATLINTVKTINGIDATQLLRNLKHDLFIQPYQTYMQVNQFNTVEQIADSQAPSSCIPTKLKLTDDYGTLFDFGAKYIINEHLTFGYGDCGFVASQTPRSFIQDFMKDETNMYLFRLFVNDMKPHRDIEATQWNAFNHIYTKDAEYLYGFHVAAFINLFLDKHAYFISLSNNNTLEFFNQIDDNFLPENTADQRYFYRQSGEHFTYCAFPTDERANKIGRIKAAMSFLGNEIRESASTNREVETVNYKLYK